MSGALEGREYPTELYARFLFYAEADLRTAERALLPPGAYWHEPCFLARESAEKALKAFLEAAGREAPELHSLRTPCRECAAADKEFLRFTRHCEVLNRYQAEARYPVGGTYRFTEALAAEAVALARELFDAVAARVEARRRAGIL